MPGKTANPTVAPDEPLCAGAVGLGIIVPIRRRQARLARDFAGGGPVPEGCRIESRRWLGWGLVSTVPLADATWLMIATPF